MLDRRKKGMPLPMLAMMTSSSRSQRPRRSASALSGEFNKAGEFDSACLIAGNYEIGMVGKIKATGRDMIAP